MGKSKAPAAPDPKETSAASTSTNVGTAIANAMMNNYNQVTPDGTLNYSQSGTYQWNDPYTGQTYDIPTFTATQTYSDQQQAIKDQEDAANLNLATLANSQSSRLNDLLGTPFSLDGAPSAGSASSLATPTYSQYSSGPTLQNSTGNTGDITKSYDVDFDTSKYQDALMSRLQPSLDNDLSALEQKLANQGIMPGSKAYETAMNQNAQNVNDARTSVLLAAGQEQSRLAGLANQQATFQNSAQQQAYNQALSDAGLNNDALQQMYNNQNTATQGNNAIAGQQFADQQTLFNAQNTERNQYLDEQYALRNQPINEISALLSGSQVSSPNFVNTGNSQIATTDVAGLINSNYQNQLAAYNQSQSTASSTLGGLFGLGAKIIGLSDERAKENIRRVGRLDNGLGVYAYNYRGDSKTQIGVIAQEVEQSRPDAVQEVGDLKVVNYEKAVA